MTAAVRCAPPDNKPTTDERDRLPALPRRELEMLPQPGRTWPWGGLRLPALRATSALRPGRASPIWASAPLGDGRTVVCSYHPSQRNTFTGMLTVEMFDAVFSRASASPGAVQHDPRHPARQGPPSSATACRLTGDSLRMRATAPGSSSIGRSLDRSVRTMASKISRPRSVRTMVSVQSL